MTPEERQEVLEQRKILQHPWHSPPHLDMDGEYFYILTASCYEHAEIIGVSSKRLAELEEELIQSCETSKSELFAWSILPSHYHLLLRTDQIKLVRKLLAQSHGRTSRKWNLEDSVVGRRIWNNCFERPLKSEAHFWASLNYVHHNTVHHGLVDHWQDWPFSSARQYIETIGREKAAEIWRQYPILDYGKKWDI